MVFDFGWPNPRQIGNREAQIRHPLTYLMPDIFACGKCLSLYEISRRSQQPLVPPRCQVCFASFPPSELGIAASLLCCRVPKRAKATQSEELSTAFEQCFYQLASPRQNRKRTKYLQQYGNS
jgi:hypothetical protein